MVRAQLKRYRRSFAITTDDQLANAIWQIVGFAEDQQHSDSPADRSRAFGIIKMRTSLSELSCLIRFDGHGVWASRTIETYDRVRGHNAGSRFFRQDNDFEWHSMRLTTSVPAVLLLILNVAIASQVTAAEGVSSATMPETHRKVFQQYCFDCHGNGATEGKVDLEHLPFTIAQDIPTAEEWQRILNVVNSGEMPPVDSEPIDDESKAAFLDALSTRMVTARRILSDSGGVITMRRLNRREYVNTIESLLGVRPDVAELPDDQAAGGFDTTGSALFVSGDQLERYLEIAGETLQVALTRRSAPASKVVRVEAEVAANKAIEERAAELRDTLARAEAWKTSNRPPTEFGFIDVAQAKKAPRGAATYLPQYEDYLARPARESGAFLISTAKKIGLLRVKLPAVPEGPGGKYTLRFRAAALPGADARAHYVEVVAQERGSSITSRLGWRKVTATFDQPQMIEFPITYPAGKKIQYFIHRRSHQGRGDKNLLSDNRRENGIGTTPGVWVDWAELEGPLPAGDGANSLTKVAIPQAGADPERDQASASIASFARRAFRGSEPTPAFVSQLVDMYGAERNTGKSPRDAIIRPLSIVLASPSFLYLVEPSEGAGSATLGNFELASRLSYFLWSAPPDDRLLSLASEGQLSKPEVLRHETARLLADERSRNFVESFLDQWLDMERLELFQYVARLYPQFDNAARESSRDEVFATFQTMLDERLPIGKMLHADFAVINDVLADHYGIDGVDGHQFRKVPLPDDSPRGGLLGMAAVHAMGSDGTRSSPVERGAWVLRYLLHDPPPPAPANVPQLSRLTENAGARALQKAHQEQPQCAQCHRKIDPIGYGLEVFNAAGQWRDEELVPTSVRFGKDITYDRFPIDPSGKLPSGEPFADYFEMRDVIGKHREDFARGFVEELIAYGLGRPFGFTDQDLADEIIAAAEADNNAIESFIFALVQSDAFRSK